MSGATAPFDCMLQIILDKFVKDFINFYVILQFITYE